MIITAQTLFEILGESPFFTALSAKEIKVLMTQVAIINPGISVIDSNNE